MEIESCWGLSVVGKVDVPVRAAAPQLLRPQQSGRQSRDGCWHAGCRRPPSPPGGLQAGVPRLSLSSSVVSLLVPVSPICYVLQGVPVVGVAVTEAYKNLPNVVPATVSGIENLFHVYEKAITFAYTVVPKDAQVLSL